MGSLLTALRKTALSFSDSEAAQPIKVLGGVIPPPGLCAAGKGKRSEPLAESEPATTYTERFSGLADRECALLLEHAHMLNLTDKCL